MNSETEIQSGLAMAGPAREPLRFRLGAEASGIDMLKVQEIRGCEESTRMANAPAYILGVVNLRGVIVSIIGMRIEYGLDEQRQDQISTTFVLNIGSQVIGMVVDSVSDVIRLGSDAIRPASRFMGAMSTVHIIGIGVLKEGERQRTLILLGIDKLMRSAEMGLVAQAEN